MSVFWKIAGVILLAVAFVVMSPFWLSSALGDGRRYLRIRKL